MLPKSPLGRAIDYTLGLWPKLETFLHHGQVEPDNNLIENAKRHGHEPFVYLKDLLERLPGMTNQQLDSLLPENWQPSGTLTASALAAG